MSKIFDPEKDSLIIPVHYNFGSHLNLEHMLRMVDRKPFAKIINLIKSHDYFETYLGGSIVKYWVTGYGRANRDIDILAVNPNKSRLNKFSETILEAIEKNHGKLHNYREFTFENLTGGNYLNADIDARFKIKVDRKFFRPSTIDLSLISEEKFKQHYK